VIDVIHTNETIDNWTELGNMTTIKGVTGVPVEMPMNYIFEQAKKKAIDAKLTVLEKDDKAIYPWIIFTIEASGFKGDKKPESQLWYTIIGKHAIYNNFRAIKQAAIPEDLKIK